MKTPTVKILFLLCTIGLFLFFAYYILASFDFKYNTPKKQVHLEAPVFPLDREPQPEEPALPVEKERVVPVEEFTPAEPPVGTPPLETVSANNKLEVVVATENIASPIVPPARFEKRGIYIPYGVFNSPTGRARITDILDTTRINTLVIDVKDSSGHIFIPMEGERYAFALQPYSSNALAFLSTLKARGTYLIARVVVFQDPLLSNNTPAYALKQKDGSVWKDFKGLSFLDPQNTEVWDYTKDIATSAHVLGFDKC